MAKAKAMIMGIITAGFRVIHGSLKTPHLASISTPLQKVMTVGIAYLSAAPNS